MNFRNISLSVAAALVACLPMAAQTEYNFTSVNYPDDTFTQLLAINSENIIAGYHGAATTAANPNKGFTYNPSTKVFTNENFRVIQGAAAVYVSSEHGRRHFCPACGTGLFYTNDQIFAGQTDVQSATLDTPEALPPTAQIQVAERIAWVEDLDSLPAFQRYPGMD